MPYEYSFLRGKVIGLYSGENKGQASNEKRKGRKYLLDSLTEFPSLL